MLSQKELTTSQLPGAAVLAAPGQAAAAPQGKRLLFVDNLRILLIRGVVVVHLAVTYRAIGDWYYYDPAYDPLTAILLSFPNFIGMATAMEVFFLIAGYFTPGSSDRKWAGPFLRDRLVRLGIPLLIYDSLIQPFVMYIAAGFPGSYGKFYTTYLLTLPAIGHGPAWFIEALLFFVMLYALWRWLNSKWSQAHPRMTTPTGSINPARTHPYPTTGAMLLYIVGLALITFVIRIWFPFGRWFPPLDQNVGEFPQYISMFILGLIAYRRGWLTQIPDVMGKRWLWVVLIDLVLFVPLVIWGGGPPSIGYFFGGLHWQALVYALWEASLVVAVSIGLLVLFRQRWNRQGRLARSLAASAYTVYLIHPVVLVGFSYAFHVVTLYPLLKWGIAVLVTLPLCFLISGLIRKIPLVNRVL